jgi:hypothetical protein
VTLPYFLAWVLLDSTGCHNCKSQELESLGTHQKPTSDSWDDTASKTSTTKAKEATVGSAGRISQLQVIIPVVILLGPCSTVPVLTPYERKIAQNIAQNQVLIESLGLGGGNPLGIPETVTCKVCHIFLPSDLCS